MDQDVFRCHLKAWNCFTKVGLLRSFTFNNRQVSFGAAIVHVARRCFTFPIKTHTFSILLGQGIQDKPWFLCRRHSEKRPWRRIVKRERRPTLSGGAAGASDLGWHQSDEHRDNHERNSAFKGETERPLRHDPGVFTKILLRTYGLASSHL